ncbi:hypothetical protein JCM10213_005841 [Rhodosporidiobolus nylandii]
MSDSGDDDYEAYALPYWSAAPPSHSIPSAGRTAGARKAASTPLVSAKEGEKGEASGDMSGNEVARQDLALLGRSDASSLSYAVKHDETAVSDLSPQTKVMKAIHILSARSREMETTGGALLEPRAVATLLELLGATLVDLQRLPPPPRTLEVNRARISFIRKSLGLPPPAELGADEQDDQVRGKVESSTPNLAAVFEENVKLLLAAIRPSTIYDPVKDTNEEVKPDSQEASLPMAPCFIAQLPPEVLSLILTFARDAATQPLPIEVPEGGRSGGAVPVRRRGHDAAAAFEGSKTAALKFSLELARVCKAWREPAREVAFRKLYIHHGLGLVKLSKLLDSGVTSSLGELVASLDVLIPSTPQAGGAGGSLSLSLQHYGNLLGTGTPVFAATSLGNRRKSATSTSQVKSGGEEQRDAGELVEKLLQRLPNLQKLKLKITIDDGYGGSGKLYADFLEPAVFRGLTTTPSLRELHLRFCTDFEELESLLNSFHHLETLRLDSLDNLAGTVHIPSSPNTASRLRTVHIGSAAVADICSLTDAQVVWLVEPSVQQGCLRDVRICISARAVQNGAVTAGQVNFGGGGAGGWLGGFGSGGGGGGAALQHAPPFASGDFADLLVRAGSSLEKLVLQDVSLSQATYPSLAAAPHNGSLDHALSHLTSLTSFALYWSSAGPSFLPSISSYPLVSLSLAGTPRHTSASAFADTLESDFPKLQTLVLAASASLVAGQGGWTGAGIRRVRQVCEERGLASERVPVV